MKVLRVVLTAVLVAGALSLLFVRQMRRFQCNQTLFAVHRSTVRIAAADGSPTDQERARDNLAKLRSCESVLGTSVVIPVLKAHNLVFLERYDAARDELLRALQLDRRPELYFNLGQIELERKDTAAAVGYFATAVRGRDDYKWEVEENLRGIILQEVDRQRSHSP